MKIFLTIVAVIYSTFCFSQQTKTDYIIIYGNDFSFSLKEPTGWTGDIKTASKYGANIIFYQSKNDLTNGGALIQAYAFAKQDENTVEDLKYDIGSYKKTYPNLKEDSFKAIHKDYNTFSKLIYIKDDFYQYITYINPGNKFKKGVTVAMNVSKKSATEKELIAYRAIVSSLIMLNGKKGNP